MIKLEKSGVLLTLKGIKAIKPITTGRGSRWRGQSLSIEYFNSEAVSIWYGNDDKGYHTYCASEGRQIDIEQLEKLLLEEN